MIKELNENNFDKEIKENQLIIIDFYATWCGPCKMLSLEMEKLSDEGYIIGKVDTDKNHDLADRFSILSIPTAYIYQNGIEKDHFVGYQSYEAIKEMILNLK